MANFSFRTKLILVFSLILSITFGVVFALLENYTTHAALPSALLNLKWQLLSVFLVSLICAFSVSYFLARSVSKPIESLVNAAKRIAKGNYRQSIRISGKNELGLLGQTLNIMQGAINQREEHITYQAQHDLLTGLPNREFAREEIKVRLDRDLHDMRNALCILQVSNLNQLTDVYGTNVKDTLLMQMARRLRNCVNKYDIAARISSNEFLIFFNQFNRQQVDQLCQQVFKAVDGTYHCEGIDILATTKIGLVYCPEHSKNFDGLLRRAYFALSQCQRNGAQYIVYQSGQDASHLRKLNITSRLQDAIRNGRFDLVFHPQFDLRHRVIKQCEVLLRWEDEELGVVFPDEFIPLAEHSGDIVHITRWVFDKCVTQLLNWKQKGIELGLCLNLSARDILSHELVDYIIHTAASANLSPHLLVFEITETAMMENPAVAIKSLQKLKDFGFHLAMDDFGTGYSSLSQLKAIPLHELKLDKSFIANIENDSHDQKIVKASIEMAHSLGLNVVAEGVQSQAASALLKLLGCDSVQGYYLCEPLPLKELETWLQSDQHSPRKVS